MEHKTSTFLSGVAIRPGFFFFAKELDDLVKKDTPNSSFFVYKEEDVENFRKYDENVGWPAISMTTFKPESGKRVVVAIGPHGDFWEVLPSTTEEVTGHITTKKVNLRKVFSVDNTIYACGMNRVVFRRTTTNEWTSFGPGPAKGDAAVVGFEDMNGFNTDELYVVGWGGEIWWCDHGEWKQVESPTKANLTAITCGTDGVVYIVGHDGTMLKGRHDKWELVETARKEDLRDVAIQGKQVYTATDFTLLKLTKDGLVPESDFAQAGDQPATCMHLLEAKDGLISLGQKDVFIKHDGPWQRLV